tara:strand:- start:241 stop:477 length:237 start_codon:yes stop_codon:yes gene_type:complete
MFNLVGNLLTQVVPAFKIAKAASELFKDNKKETFDEKVDRINLDAGKYAGLQIENNDEEVVINCRYKKIRLQVSWIKT